MFSRKWLTLAVAAAVLAGCLEEEPVIAEGTTLEVALLETTDLHTNVLSYDYFKLSGDQAFGLERTASLIKSARAQFPNTLLFDNGDTIQGTALADYQATVNPIGCGERLAIYKVMSSLGFDAGNIGNHEFNYGLPFLSQVTNTDFRIPGFTKSGECAGPSFPLVLTNVVATADDKPLFPPYSMLSREFTATTPTGERVQVPLKVGVLGFTPPQIMSWDKRHLDGKVYVSGLVESATRYVQELRSSGADLVVALSHGGLDPSPYMPTMENGSWHLTQVPGIDALMFGHSHDVFPNPGDTRSVFNNLAGVDNTTGRVNGIPTVMAGNWGNRLGVIQLTLQYVGGKWVVVDDKTVVESRSIRGADGTLVEADPSVATLVDAEHKATIDYVKTPIGTSDFRMSTYFALVGDVSALQIVNMAQADYVARYVQTSLPQYASLPVLSVTAPFKGGRNGANDYTDVAAGPLAIFNAADLYLYPNTVQAVKVTGSTLKAWLEKSAQQFKQIDPTRTTPQELIDSTFPTFNFDVMYGDIQYQIDVTQPAGSRIVNLTYKGEPVSQSQEFIIATNNYRASGGGNFPGIDGSKTILQAPDANRDVLIQYIKDHPSLTYTAYGSTRVWSFVPVTTAGPVTFRSTADKLALAQASGIANVSMYSDNGDGTWLYSIDLSR